MNYCSMASSQENRSTQQEILDFILINPATHILVCLETYDKKPLTEDSLEELLGIEVLRAIRALPQAPDRQKQLILLTFGVAMAGVNLDTACHEVKRFADNYIQDYLMLILSVQLHFHLHPGIFFSISESR